MLNDFGCSRKMDAGSAGAQARQDAHGNAVFKPEFSHSIS
jgi:hypothetical protein